MIAVGLAPRLLNPKGFLLLVAALLSLASVFFLTPITVLDRWEQIPYWIRGAIFGFLGYATLVTIGNFSELYSFRLWLDFLFLRAGTPFTSTHAIGIAAAFFGYSTQRYAPPGEMPNDRVRVINGPKLLSLEMAKAILERVFAQHNGEPKFLWGGILRPISSGTEHYIIIGAPGTGKSKILQFVMEWILPLIRPGSNKRAVVYDAKRDIYSTLRGMGLHEERLKILNPFDERSVAWDMAKDITDSATAVEIGTLLVPDKGEVQPYFPEAARVLLGAAMESLNVTAFGKWTLRDVVLTLQSEQRTRIVLGHAQQTKYVIEKYLAQNETYYSIASTLENTMRRLGFVAAGWDRSKESVSLSEWIKSEEILVLGNTLTHESIIQQVNAAIVRRMSQVILDQEEANRQTPEPQTWIFIDELRCAGFLPDFAEFMIQARSKGGCVVLGLQDFPGLVAAYKDENLAKEIIGTCANKGFLKISEQDTAKLGASYFDEQLVEITHYSPSWSQSITESLQSASITRGTSVSESQRTEKRPVVSSADLKGLPRANYQDGIQGYYLDGRLQKDVYGATLPGELVAKLVQPLPDVPNFIPRPGSHLDLRPWDAADLERLGLSKYSKELLNPAPAKKEKKKRGPIAQSQ